MIGMNLNELIIETSQQNNVTEEEIRVGLTMVGKQWDDEHYIKSMGILGNSGIQGSHAWYSLFNISRAWDYSRLKEATHESVGLESATALFALQEELFGVVNI